MNMQTTRKSYTRATLTTEDAMKMIQHIAAYGTEATHLDVHVTRHGAGDATMYISINNGFGITLKVTESLTEIIEEENAK